MNTTMFLPKEIKVGFRERSGTYNGKLAYVIYIDEKGKVRKEKSFESWRSHDIPTEQFENEPTSGFVLNKKAGGYSTGWNHRQTYVRIYDPRGFEFEISIENLLYILDNTSSIIGKGLEGEFVYAWSGSDLVLVPVNAPEYEELKKLNDLRHKKDFVKAKDLKVGATYLTKNNDEIVFLGKFDEYEYGWRNFEVKKKAKKQFYFAESGSDGTFYYRTFQAVTRFLINVIDENPHPELHAMFEHLEFEKRYSPIDHSKSLRVAMTIEDFIEYFSKHGWGSVVGANGREYDIHTNRHSDKKISFNGEYKEEEYNRWGRMEIHKVKVKNMYDGVEYEVNTLEDVFNILKPIETHYYQENGNFYTKQSDAWNE